MNPILLLFLLALVLSGALSWFLSRKLYVSLKADHGAGFWTVTISLLVFFTCFALLMIAAAVVIGSAFRFER